MTNTWKVYKTADGKIAVDLGEYAPAINKALKQLGPARWHAETRTWRFPLLWEICKGIRAVAIQFDRDLKIYPSLAEWAYAERTRQAEIPDVQSVELQELPRLAATYPYTYRAMAEGDPAKDIPARPFQTVGAKFIATNRAALIADEPGLGKTLQTIAAVVEADIRGPILVVGPKAAVGITWPAEIERWAPGETVLVIGPHLSPGNREALLKTYAEDAATYPNGRVWICVGPNYIRRRVRLQKGTTKFARDAKGDKIYDYVKEAVPAFFDYAFATVIVDESHQTLAGCTGNVAKQSAQRQGLGGLRIAPNGLRVALSGTPFRGKQENLWGQLNWLRPDLYTAYWKWVEKHFDVYDDGFGMVIGELRDEAAMYAEAASVMIRRTKAEVAKDLPPKLYGGEPLDGDGPVAVWLPMLKTQKRQYEQMVKHGVADLKGGTIMANATLAQITRLRQLACGTGKLVDEEYDFTGESNKLDWLIEFLDARGIDRSALLLDDRAKNPRHRREALPKIIVASQFTKLLNAFATELGKVGIPTFLYTGETSDKEREHIKDDFQNNRYSSKRVVLLNLGSGGVSLTLDAADDVVTLDEAWNKDDEEQVVDRAHRLSRMHQVNVWRLRSLGTIEEGYARNTTETARGIKAVLDAQRGVNIEQLLLGKKVA